MEKLISLVKEQECLWNQKNANYHTRHIQREKWNEIALELNESGEELKKKWRSLRDIFRREYKKCTNRSGEPINDYTPKWSFYKSMVFLNDTMVSRDMKGSVPIELDSNDSRTDAPESDLEQGNGITEQEDSPIPLQTKPALKRKHVLKPPQKKKIKRRRETCDYDEAFLKIEEEKLKYFKGNVQDSEMQFLMSLHPFLKRIPTSRQLEVRMGLMQLLMNPEETMSPCYFSSPDVQMN